MFHELSEGKTEGVTNKSGGVGFFSKKLNGGDNYLGSKGTVIKEP